MLQRYRVELVTEEPATLGMESETAFLRDVYRYVPGIVLRGALAAVWIGRNGLPDGPRRLPFRDLFEVGLRPGPLLPEGGYVRPVSVTQCKYPLDATHARASARDQAFEEQLSCPVGGCGGPVEPGRGIVEFEPGRDPVVTLTHVAHDNQTGVAVDKGLHARHYLRPGTRFTGHMSAPTDAFLDSFAAGDEVWLGGRRTVAGRARLTIAAEQPEQMRGVAAGEDVALRLVSPGVFVDDAGRPGGDPIPELAEALGLAPDRCKVRRRWWRPVTIRGWHMATGLPKPTDQAAAPGSTWLVRVEDAVPGDRLAALAIEGMGLRRSEGFGRVALARDAWRPDPPPAPVPDRSRDRAVERVALLWPYLAAAGALDARRIVGDHLRELAGTPVHRWGERSRALWVSVRGGVLERTGIRGALSELVQTEEPELVRDVRQVLAAAARSPIPRWLELALTSGVREGTGR
jgi:CRISPR-associated protein Csx10